MPGTESPSIGELPPVGKLYRFEEIPDAHDEMERGVDVFGNRVALAGACEPDLGRK
jgi:hypothetical protein